MGVFDRRAVALGALLALLPQWGCRSDGERTARKLCEEARAMDATDPRGALVLRRRIWEKLPTTGTPSAAECGRDVKLKMGSVRVLVATDEAGDPAAVDGCAWAADAVEVFAGSPKLPYRAHWTRRLMERCQTVVERAWTREPDSERLRHLHERLERLAATEES